jgi:hypothetical protein
MPRGCCSATTPWNLEGRKLYFIPVGFKGPDSWSVPARRFSRAILSEDNVARLRPSSDPDLDGGGNEYCSAGTGAPALQWISPPTRGAFVEGRIFSETARPGKTRHPGFRRRHTFICGADIRNASGFPSPNACTRVVLPKIRLADGWRSFLERNLQTQSASRSVSVARSANWYFQRAVLLA